MPQEWERQNKDHVCEHRINTHPFVEPTVRLCDFWYYIPPHPTLQTTWPCRWRELVQLTLPTGHKRKAMTVPYPDSIPSLCGIPRPTDVSTPRDSFSEGPYHALLLGVMESEPQMYKSPVSDSISESS